ncbi:Peptidase family M28 [Nocardioides psychrotolerans]|uniref:Peptidase family M28 n=2 Tax=Nocardioides psychrotolerans TaxID=1005945 RepID=A0A1I3PP68_9ACTN|nr:Peptidase family M28 [Nocardioides psychrotolerans]
MFLLPALAGCSSSTTEPGAAPPPPASSTPAPTTPSTSPTQTPTPTPTPQQRASPDDVDVTVATRAVRHLAGTIGPRPGTSAAYFAAADWVQQQLEASGWEVRRQHFATPAGVSWGIPVEAGSSVNLVATRGDTTPGEPWLAVGAHLDTVPQAPGAEDNASGVGALLATAAAIAGRQTRMPVVLVAFGSEEPRGPSDDDHHYGSRAYVASLTPAERRGLRAMVSLDRVGVGDVMPVGTPAEPNALTDEIVAAARRAGEATVLDTFQRSSDHWSFVREGIPGARLGSTPYPGYHDESDIPSVVRRSQLEAAARIVVAWLR